MLTLLLVHLAAAIAAPGLIRRLGPRAFYLLATVPLAAAAWAVAQRERIAAGGAIEWSAAWIGPLDLELALRTDSLSWLMVLLVGGIGGLVLVYCARYFAACEPGLGQFAGVFVAFAGSMLGLVMSDDLLMLYVFWELTTVCSYLLIGHVTTSRTSRRAALQALVVTTAGGLAMLAGIVMLGESAGTYRWSELAHTLPGGRYLAAAMILILLGALSKSAIYPFSFWLPAAMAAPTPVSAYLHAAAMVKAGVFLIAQFTPAIVVAGGPAVGSWRTVVLVGGLGTMLAGGWSALRQYDLKLLLAYGTVSQLGLLTVMLGAGRRDTALAGAALMAADALAKAALFLIVGIIEKTTGTRDLRRLSGLYRRAPALAVAAALAAASTAGLPPLIGFVAKEAILTSLLEGGAVERLVLVGVVVGSMLTVAYSLRFLWGAFATRSAAADEPSNAAAVDPRGGTSPPSHAPAVFRAPSVSRAAAGVLLGPPLVLAVACVAAGFAAAPLDRQLSPYADRIAAAGPGYHLGLWHGLGAAFGLSTLVIIGGVVWFWAVQRQKAHRSAAAGSRGQAPYYGLMAAVDRAAVAATAMTQRGSLPFYLALILIALVAAATTVLVVARPFAAAPQPWDSPLQILPAAVMIIAAVFAVHALRRLTAVILVGLTGYALAGLFVLYGAPDLALTQFLVETTTLVMVVLVLRRLPSRFSQRPTPQSRWSRIGLGAAVGTIVAVMTHVAVTARQAIAVSIDFPDISVSYGGGLNIVNVILVDIRAWDTMGEISVLVAVATGVASLIFRRAQRLRRRGPGPLPEPPRDEEAWLMAGHTLEAGRRSPMLEVMTRLLFHPMMLLSIYLLFTGHNTPGGGFAGGLVAAAALMIRYLAGGRHELAAAAPVNAGAVLGGGLLIAVGVGVGAMLLGGQVLQSTVLDVEVPLLGHVHLVSSTLFDIGVYLIVVGLVLDVLRSLGAEIDRHQEADRVEETA